MAFKNRIFLSTVFLISIFTWSLTKADINSSVESQQPQKVATSPLQLTASLEIPTHSFLISTSAGRVNQRDVDQRIQYNPTFGPNIGIHGSYEQWSLGFKKRFYFNNPNDEKKYGKTDYDDYRLGYNFSEFFSMDAYYQNYRGFYTDLSGQEGLQATFNGSGGGAAASSSQESQIISRSDILTRNYGLRALLTLPLMPFFKAFSTQKEEIPVDWDFNVLSKVYYNHLEIVGDQALVPDVTANSFSPISSLKEFSANTLGVGFGLGVLVRATPESSFGFSALAGPGFQRQANIYSDHSETRYTTATEINANFSYEWKNLIHGFKSELYFDTVSSKVNDVHFDSSHLGLNLAYSYSGLQF